MRAKIETITQSPINKFEEIDLETLDIKNKEEFDENLIKFTLTTFFLVRD
ncbi:hypothetical protein [Mycoplasmoides alvi]|nr:hypothetical protein [Mycoplasmoides alvi]